MKKINISVKNGKKVEFAAGTTYYEICKVLNMDENLLAVQINNEIISLDEKAMVDAVIFPITKTHEEGFLIYKSGLKLIFQVALKNVMKEAEVSYEHSVPDGMLAYVKSNQILLQDDITKLRIEMSRIINEDLKIKKLHIRKKEAIDFYNSTKEFEKANNVANITDSVVNLYKLEGVHNYFYSDMPYSTGVVNDYDIVYLGNNKLIFVLPSSKSDYEVPEYIHFDGIINTFLEGKKWLESQKMNYINNLNVQVGNGRVKKFMRSCEINFNINVGKVIEQVLKRKKVKFIMLAGPSSSGKTTTAKRMSVYLTALGYDPISMSTDDYFVDRENSPRDEKGNIDFECLEAIDLKYFNNDLNKLLNGETISMPKYNFISGKKEISGDITKLKENSIIIIEGLHSLNDNLMPEIDSELKYKVYLSPFLPLNMDRHNYISTIDLRLIRRIVRDNQSRGYGVATTIHNWNLVRGGEQKHIFPYIHQADSIINTALAYEIGVLKVYIEPLLLSVGVGSNYYAEAQRILCFLKHFFPIPGELVRKDSILREFIGGSDD